MPFGDGTGPMGQGPRTGRGFGYCSGHPHFGCMGPRGRGFGRGWRRGWGFPYSQQLPTEKEEKEMLQDDLEALKEETTAIEERIKELEGKKK